MVPRAVRGASPSARTPPTPGRSSSSRLPATPLAFAPGPVHDALRRSASARCRSRSAATRRAGRARAHRARGRRSRRRRSVPPSPGDVLGVRGPFGTPGRSPRLDGARRRRRRRRDRPRAAAPGDPARCSRDRERYGAARRCSTAARTPDQLLYADELDALAPSAASSVAGDRRQRRARAGSATSASSPS